MTINVAKHDDEEAIKANERILIHANMAFRVVTQALMESYPVPSREPSSPEEIRARSEEIAGMMIGTGAAYETFFLVARHRGQIDEGAENVLRQNAKALASSNASGTDINFTVAK